MAAPILGWRALRLAAGASAVVVTLLALAPVAAMGQADRNRLIYSLRLDYGARGSFLGQLFNNCDDLFVGGLAEQPQGRWVYVNGDGSATGALNVSHGRGEVFIKGLDWQVESLPPAPPPVRFADVGISLRRGKMFVTARITSGPAFFTAARRTPIAQLRGVKTQSGPLVDQHRRPIPNSFSFTGSGRATILPAMARALDRARCKDPRRGRFSRPINSRTPLGRFVFGVRPDRAMGLAGSAQIGMVVFNDMVSIEPTAGATTLDNRLVAPITSRSVPLGCYSGLSCFPSAGSVALGGGFDLVFAGHHASVANLVLTTTGTAPDSLHEALTGTLDGAPVTVFTKGPLTAGLPGFTSDFAQRAGAALGTVIGGEVVAALVFTSTGPA